MSELNNGDLTKSRVTLIMINTAQRRNNKDSARAHTHRGGRAVVHEINDNDVEAYCCAGYLSRATSINTLSLVSMQGSRFKHRRFIDQPTKSTYIHARARHYCLTTSRLLVRSCSWSKNSKTARLTLKRRNKSRKTQYNDTVIGSFRSTPLLF